MPRPSNESQFIEKEIAMADGKKLSMIYLWKKSGEMMMIEVDMPNEISIFETLTKKPLELIGQKTHI